MRKDAQEIYAVFLCPSGKAIVLLMLINHKLRLDFPDFQSRQVIVEGSLKLFLSEI